MIKPEQSISAFDIHKFLNKQNESYVDEEELGKKTDMMGFKQREVDKEIIEPKLRNGGVIIRS